MPSFGQNLDRAKALAIAEVNMLAGQRRSQYITTADGQEMVYLGKEAEAIRYLADPAPVMTNYPFLSCEVGITAPTVPQLAALWVNIAHYWRGIASVIEAARMYYTAQISNALTVLAVNTALNDFRAVI